MNFRTHKKGLIALALVFFMLAPMLMAGINLVHADNSATGTLSVVQDSSIVHNSSYNPVPTSTTSVTIPATTPLGTVLAFDVVINNAANVNGWSMPTVTWNSAVLTMITAKEGPFLANNAASTATAFLLGAVQTGQVGGGISDAIEGSAQCAISWTAGTAPPAGAVLTTMFFTVVGYGTSSVNIIGTGGNQAYLHTAPGTSDPAIPVTATDATVTQNSPPLSISIVPHGATSGSTYNLPSNTNPVGTTLLFDAYISGATGNIWAWSLNVNWNASILALNNVAEGSYLSQSGSTLFAVGYINNAEGLIQGGVADAYTTLITQPAGAGVLMTLNFTVVGFGNSNIGITAGSPAALLGDQSSPTPTPTQPTLVGMLYTWTPLPPTNPVAIATVTNSPFGTGSDNTYTGYGVTVSGASSTQGINTQPPNTPCPITTYAWSITLVNGTIITVANSETVALTAAEIGQVAGNIAATLTVTAPATNPAPGYVSTSSTTLTVVVQAPYAGGVLDIWTQNGGQGYLVDSSSFGPQQIVDLYAYVSYNGAPVVDKTVTFEVSGPAGITYVTAPTDQSGLAIASYRLPWQDSNPTQYFGEMTVSGSVDLAQAVLNDTVNFYYGYQLSLNSVTITNGNVVAGVPNFNRYGMAGAGGSSTDNNVVDATVSVTNTMWNSQSFWLSAVIYDNNSVPVAQFLIKESIGPALPLTGNTNLWSNSYTQTYNIMPSNSNMGIRRTSNHIRQHLQQHITQHTHTTNGI